MFSINDRHHYRFNATLREDTLLVWQDTVDFVNRINLAAIQMPDDAKRDLKQKILDASIRIADRVAKASGSPSQTVLESRLRDAVEAVHETMARLYVAKQWSYIAEGYYQELFEGGRRIVDRICLFGGFEYTSREAN